MNLFSFALALQAASAAASTPPPCVATFQARARQECPRFVFFDSGKTEIRRDWQGELDAVAGRLRALPGSRVLLIGRSDASGPAGANLRVSRQRALVIRDMLAQRGVPSARIEVQGTGEAELLVPTPDGVREAQNRRVDMVVVLPR